MVRFRSELDQWIATTEIHKVDFLGFNYQMEPEESLLLSFRVRLSSEHLHDKLMILHVGRFGRIGHRRQRVVLGNKIVKVIKVTGAEGCHPLSEALKRWPRCRHGFNVGHFVCLPPWPMKHQTSFL